jgi:hypothetical protein
MTPIWHRLGLAAVLTFTLCLGAAAFAQDEEEYEGFPPPPGDDFGEPPAVAPLTPDDPPPPGYFEPPPGFAPPRQSQQAPKTGDPNPGMTASGTEEVPVDPTVVAPLPPKGQTTPAPRPHRAARAQINLDELMVPPYQRHRPQWAIGAMTSLAPLGACGSAANMTDPSAIAAALQVEFQPRIFQKFGVLGIGPTFTVFPSNDLTSSLMGLWGVSGQIRYQLRYFREQWVVPTAAYSFGSIFYDFSAGSGSVSVSGPILGAMVLLNVVDPDSAASFYSDLGVSRSYLVAEYHLENGSDGTVNFGGEAFYFGLRVEF